MASDFNLLAYVGVDDPGLPKSENERRAEERRRKMAFDDMQYRAHVEQEQRRRERAENNFSGRCHRFPHRDTMHHHGNYWFAEGTVPSTHDVVGKAPPQPADAPIAHTIDGVASSTPSARGRSTQVRSASPSSSYAAGRAATPPAGSRSTATPQRSADRQQQYTYSEHSDRAARAFQRERDEPMVVLRTRTPPPSPASVAKRTWEAADADGHPRINNRFARVGSPRRGSGASPYATHYDPAEVFENGSSRPQPHVDREGTLRGAGGRDELEAQLRAAQRHQQLLLERESHDRRKAMQETLRRDLDAAVSMKRYVKAEERRQDDQATFGVSLPIPTIDPRSRAELLRRRRQELEQVWSQQAAAHRDREAADAARTQPDRSMWWLDAERRENNAEAERAARQEDPKSSWKRAWQEHQAAAAEAERQRDREARRIEEMTLSANVANYADRIILAEQQRKEAQRQYARELDEQTRARDFNRPSLIAETHRRDHRFSRGPFTQYPSTFM